MSYIGLYIYCVGCVIAFFHGLYMIYKTEHSKETKDADYTIIAAYTLMSWFSIGITMYSHFKNKKK